MKDLLEELRKNIKSIDEQIINKIAERIYIAKQIGKIKKQQSLPIQDSQQWEKVINNIVEKSKEKKLDNGVIKKIYEIIHNYTLTEEAKVT